MKIISYAKLQEKYANEYIARRNSKIFAHAKTYPALTKKLGKLGIDRTKLIIGFVPPKGTICIYTYAL